MPFILDFNTIYFALSSILSNIPVDFEDLIIIDRGQINIISDYWPL